MRLDVYVPVLAALLMGVAVRPLARLLPPGIGFRVLVAVGLISAAGWVWTLGLLAWTAVGQIPLVARYGGWSVPVLQADNPVAAPIAYTAAAALAVVTVLVARASIRRLRAVAHSWKLARSLAPAGGGELVVLPDPTVEAFALPSFDRRCRGHIVVTAGMLRALDPAERRVLFAHERAHLDGAHHWWLLAAQLTAAANPFLVRLPATVDHLLERAADETAATAVTDRCLAARALARAGLAALHHPPAPARGIALAYTGSTTEARITALLAPPPQSHRALLAILVMTVALVVVSAADAGRDLETLFELAMHTRG
ncbi:MAG: M48 family metalloprotease [Pseudonocardia sp.]|uniref:M48 family metalloprotease n=1 Tax=Pseudonocardia sp. TaxID=60912 RepID=UPI001AC26E6D|nr:M48 family metalloprotease [Pseudonocardia sp.]MBN9098216.1 M48 family metalloprotease [Pseudonocardia sp.]